MKLDSETSRHDADKTKLDAEEAKLKAETRKLNLQTRWIPMIEGAALLGGAHAIIKLYFP